MKKLAATIIAATSLFPAAAYADHERERCYDSGGCSDNEHDYSNHDRNRNRDRNRGAFSPGPFDRSPVDIHDNQVCISPDCSNSGSEKKGGDKKGDQPTPGENGSRTYRLEEPITCLVPFPYHCDPKPK